LPYQTLSGELVNATRNAIAEVVDIQPTLSTDGGTSDGRFIAPTGAQVIELGPINRTIHQVDEAVSIEDLEHLSQIYQQILKHLLS
ncbi:MAG: M20/M25/M40 family metallo-hydrolase, partial [Arenicellales bacterium]|nr:M20/M25/M40 family metallo-hydrolase [Arenicellales bacterium]